MDDPKRNCQDTEGQHASSLSGLTCILNLIGGISWDADPGTLRFLRVGPEASHVLGYPVDHWLNDPGFWKEKMHPEDRDAAWRTWQSYARAEACPEFEFRMISVQGKEIWFRCLACVENQESAGSVLRGVFLNVGREKLAIKALKSSEERLELALEGSGLGAWDWDIPSGRVIYSERLQSMLGYSPGELGEDLSGWKNLIHPEDLSTVLAALDAHLKGTTASYETEHRLKHKNGSWIWVLDKGRVVERDATGSAVRAAGTHMDITSRKAAFEALADREELLAQLFKLAPDSLFMVSAEGPDAGRILMANDAATDQHGYTHAELLAMNIHQLDGPEDAKLASQRIEALRNRGSMVFEVQHRRKDGSQILMEASAKLVELGGKRAILAFNRDVSERKKAEERLKVLETCISNLNDVVLVFESGRGSAAGMKLIYANQALEKTTGYAREELFARGMELIREANLQAELLENLGNSIRNGKPCSTELSLTTKSGEQKWLGMEIVPLPSGTEGTLYWILLARDETKRKETESRDADFRVRLELASKAGEIGYWDWNLITNQVYFSTEWKQQLGHGPDEVENNYEEWENRLHPADREAVLHRLRGYLDGVFPNYETEFRLRHKDGSYRWILVRGESIKDPAGKNVRLLGCHIDITGRKNHEREIWRSRELLEQTGEVAEVGGWELDVRSGKLRWSPQTCRIHGLTPDYEPSLEEAIEFYAPEARIIIRKAVKQCIERATPFDLVLPFHSRDGRFLWVRSKGQAEIQDGIPIRIFGAFQNITQARQAEERIREGEERLRALVEASSQIVWTADVNGAALEESHTWTRYTGKSAYGRDGWGWVDSIHPVDRPRVLDQWQEAIGGTQAVEIQYRLRHHSGDWRWNLVRAVPLKHADGTIRLWVGMNADIHDRKRATDDLQLARFSIERAAQSIFWILPDARISDVNEAATSLLGYTRTELVSMRIEDFAPEYPSKSWGTHWSDLKARQVMKFTSRLRRKNGTEVDVEIQAHFLTFGGQEFNCAFILDISDRIASEKMKASLQEQLVRAQKMEALGTLAGGIAHDFNNILGVMLGNAELAKLDVEPGGAVDESLDEITKAARRARALVQQILTFSRQQSDNRSVIDLKPVVRAAADFIRASIPASIEVLTSIEEETPPVVGDPAQINQVLLNLCTNSWHAMEGRTGRITLGLQGERIDEQTAGKLGGLKAGLHVVLTITDTGAGMSKEVLNRVFDPFFTTKEVGKGTGLGLSVVHGIVKGHQGAISIESEPGVGTTCRIHLPVAQNRDHVQETGQLPARRGSGETVLMVDDEKSLLKAARMSLERLGYKITAFSSPIEALTSFQSDPDACQVVVTDSEMPGMRGLTLAAEIKKIRPQLPIILCSGYLNQAGREESERLGIHCILEKPIDLPRLASAISECIERGASETT